MKQVTFTAKVANEELADYLAALLAKAAFDMGLTDYVVGWGDEENGENTDEQEDQD